MLSAPVPAQTAPTTQGETTRLLPRADVSPATLAQPEITRNQMINAYPIPGLKTALHYFFTLVGYISFLARDESKTHYLLRQENPSSANKWLNFQLFIFVITAGTKTGLSIMHFYSTKEDPTSAPNVSENIALTIFVETISLLVTLIIYDMARVLARKMAYVDTREVPRQRRAQRDIEAQAQQIAYEPPPALPDHETPAPPSAEAVPPPASDALVIN